MWALYMKGMEMKMGMFFSADLNSCLLASRWRTSLMLMHISIISSYFSFFKNSCRLLLPSRDKLSHVFAFLRLSLGASTTADNLRRAKG